MTADNPAVDRSEPVAPGLRRLDVVRVRAGEQPHPIGLPDLAISLRLDCL